MPRMGSFTQSPRQPTIRRGGSIFPRCGQGLIKISPITGLQLKSGLRLGNVIAHTIRPMPNLKAPGFKGTFVISGISRDSAGSPLGNCTIRVFYADAFDQKVLETSSDGGGNYSFNLPGNSTPCWVVAYKAGAPNLSGATDRNLVATSVG